MRQRLESARQPLGALLFGEQMGNSDGARKMWLRRRPPQVVEQAPDGDGLVLRITTSSGAVHTVRFDAADLPAVAGHTWSAVRVGSKFYAATHCKRPDGRDQVLRMHRMLAGAPKGLDVDHCNGDGLDNRRANLRVCTRSQNLCNRGHLAASGFKGVCLADTVTPAYRAQIAVRGTSRHLGTFSTPEGAARAYDRAAIELHGEFARTNFPRKDYE